MRFLAASLIALATVATPAVPAFAQTAAKPADAQAAGVFIDQLADQAFAVLKDKSLAKPQLRAKFRTMLRSNFDVNIIGAKLIRSHRAAMTPAGTGPTIAACPTPKGKLP